MQKTANQIKSSFETLASGHYQIHSFLYAQEFEQQAYENLIYPLMLVYPLGGSLSGTTYSRNYRVIIADRVLKSEGNELEVESDTQLIALDVLAYWMKLGQNERFTITSSNTITPFWEKWGDEVTGHFVDIGIEEFYDFNSCAIPLSGSIPTPPNPCKDARISVNSVVYGNAPSDSNFNVVVKNQSGALVGSLIGGEWIVNTGSGCADANYTIEDSLGNVLYSGTIPSGGSLIQAINNSTLNVNKSDGSLISSRSILAEDTDSYNVADSLITNANVSPTYSQLVKATEGLILPTQSIQNNGVASGFIPSVGTINVTTNSAPTSFTITGRTIDIVVPSGGGSYDLDLVDRFGNTFPTKQVSANATWDLRTLTPFDWADLFLSRETSWGVSGFYTNANVVTAVTELVSDLFAANVWQLLHGIYPLVGGTATKHKWNLRYPFDNDNSLRLNFVNAPTHDREGIKFNSGTTNNQFCCVITDNPSNLMINEFGHFSAYYRSYIAQTNNTDLRVLGDSRQIWWHLNDPGAGSGTLRMSWCSPVYQVNPTSALTLTGHWTLNRPNSTNIRQIRNGIVERDISGNNSTAALYDGVNVYQNYRWGGGNKTMSAFTLGRGLTPTQELDLYNAIQKFQTTLGRQV